MDNLKKNKKFQNIKELIIENKKRFIILDISSIILILLIAICFIKISINRGKMKTISYTSDKNIEYKVDLKRNDFYKTNYVENGNQYIATLIENINTNFKYKFNLDKDYKYTYKIVGVLDVTEDKTSKSIYKFKENLINERKESANGSIEINENFNIDFERYNDLVKKFLDTYELKNVTSVLNVSLEFEVAGENFKKSKTNVMSLDIPLGSNTISIDTNYNVENDDNKISLNNNNKTSIIGITFGVILLIIDSCIVILTIVFNKKWETDEEKYKKELKRIMNNYASYISKIEDGFDMEGYQILKVEKFVDLLEIRDTMQLPIIMLENKEQLITCFVIPTSAKLLYFYSLNQTQFALPKGDGMNDEEKECIEKIEENI